MLKIGDKVRAKVFERSIVSGELYYKAGWTGVVVNIHADRYLVDWSENPGHWLGGQWYILIENAEPA